MPRISAATNAAQRENTKRAILDSFGEILYTRGLPGLTMTDVAKNAGIGRTAVYNYFADMGELLVAYALDETERFLNELRVGLDSIETLLAADSTFYGDLFPHVVKWGGELYLEDGVHRALRNALHRRAVMYARVLDLDSISPALLSSA